MPEIRVAAPDGGNFMAYLAVPGVTPAPVIVVIQEIFGVNQVMRELCDGFAKDGYLALCPDLFWRQQPGVILTDRTPAEWARAVELMQGLDTELAIADLQATVAHARSLPGATGLVGSVGFCLGGKLAFLMAARSNTDCAVSYYGVGLEGLLPEAASIRKPLLIHIAEEDRFVTKDAQARIRSAFASLPMVTVYCYPGVNHAFARLGGEHYDQASAELANARTAAFLSDCLQR